MNVLIVEDEGIVAMDIEEKLSSLHYNIVGIANNYVGAFEIIEEESIDLVLLDINIRGDKNGFDIATTLNREYSIPFVFLTAYSSNQFIEKVKKVNAYGYVLKPYRIGDLISSIEIARTKFEIEQDYLFQKEELNQIVKEKTTRLLQINKQLNQEIALRKLMKTKLANAENTERNRIAMELHDGIGQKITSAKFILGALSKRHKEDKEATELINEVKNTLNNLIQTIRNVSEDLTPTSLTEKGFKKAIEEVIDDLNFDKTVNVVFNYNSDLDPNSVISKVIFRLIQEALNNAFKYSKCKNIEVTINKISNRNKITIIDDGIGIHIDKLTMEKGGLKNMAYRCNLHDGEFDIYSKPNEGTTISIII